MIYRPSEQFLYSVQHSALKVYSRFLSWMRIIWDCLVFCLICFVLPFQANSMMVWQQWVKRKYLLSLSYFCPPPVCLSLSAHLGGYVLWITHISTFVLTLSRWVYDYLYSLSFPRFLILLWALHSVQGICGKLYHDLKVNINGSGMFLPCSNDIVGSMRYHIKVFTSP